MQLTLTSGPPKLTAARRPPEINVTPLVDVVLVLLIIFMVIAPQLESGERVELPGITNTDATSKLEAYTVTVANSGRILFEKEQLAEAALVPRLKEAHDRAADKRLVLKADKGVRYGKMRDIFAKAQEVGFPGVALMVDEKKQERK